MEVRSGSIASVLAQLASDDAGADRIAAAVAENMHAIHLALAPIIGDRGVSALYRRSLLLAARDVPGAPSFHAAADADNDYATLQSALAQQAAADAAVIAQALFSHLYTILASLIGAALTERLLHPMFDTSANGHAVQELPHE